MPTIPGTIFHFFACLAIVGGLFYTLRVRNEGAVIEGLAGLLEGLLIAAAGVVVLRRLRGGMSHEDGHRLYRVDARIEIVLPEAPPEGPGVRAQIEIVQGEGEDLADGVPDHVAVGAAGWREESGRTGGVVQLPELQVSGDDRTETRGNRDGPGVPVGVLALDVDDVEDPLLGVEVRAVDETDLLGAGTAPKEHGEHRIGPDETAVVGSGDLGHAAEDPVGV